MGSAQGAQPNQGERFSAAAIDGRVNGQPSQQPQRRIMAVFETTMMIAVTCRSRRKESLTVDVSIASIAADQLVPSSSSGQTQQQGLYEETWNKGFLQHGQTFVKHTSTSADGPQLVSTPSCEAPLSLLASSAFESLHGVLAAAKKWDGATSFQEAAEGFPAHPQTSQSQHCQPPAVPTAHAAAQAQEGRSQPARLPCQQHCQGMAVCLVFDRPCPVTHYPTPGIKACTNPTICSASSVDSLSSLLALLCIQVMLPHLELA
jgi:hypothetical protein